MDKRHLTIMFTDIKGFTHRTSHSSREQLKKLLELHDELICPFFNEFGGTIVKTIGDAFLVTFHSPTDAVLCGMKIQKELAKFNAKQSEDERLDIRIAINSGEVLVKKDGDVFGEAVNIAARLEGVAEPGDIFFTESVYLAMNKAEIPTAEVGYRHFKGIPEEVKVYKVLGEEITKGLFNKKEKAVVRGSKQSSQTRWQKVFMWIGIIFVALVLLNAFGIGIAVLALLIYLIYKFFFSKEAKRARHSKQKNTIKTLLKWALIIFLALFVIGLLSNSNQKASDTDGNTELTARQQAISQINNLRIEAEEALDSGDRILALAKVNEIKDIAKDYNTPEIDSAIANIQDRLN